MEANFTLRPLYHRGWSPPLPTEYDAGWISESVWSFGDEKHLMSLPRIETGFLDLPPCNPDDNEDVKFTGEWYNYNKNHIELSCRRAKNLA
jgi:hypothetical protein